jgi:hypothetical protein
MLAQTFHGSTAPHFWCVWCNVLWVSEMDYLLRCTEPHHVSEMHKQRQVA